MIRRASLLTLVVALFSGSSAWAQLLESGLAGSQVVTARKEANLIRVDGRVTVLLWARGLQDPLELDAYAAAGLNTAYVMVSDSSDEGLAEASALASAAEARGLMVVAALAPASLRDPEGIELAADGLSDAYREAVGDFVDRAAAAMADHPGLIAWSVEAVPPDRAAWGDAGFQAYLEDWYGSLAALNSSWGVELSDWAEVNVAGVRDIDTTLPGGLGRASVDFAYYRSRSYADTLAAWAAALRASDPGRLVFASALPDYRSIISVPADFDGLVLNTYPSLAEADWQTHNVQAVDIARRANRFAAIQTLEVDPGTDANRMANWANAALLHGATGLAFSNWAALRDSDGLRQMVRRTADAIRESGAFPAEPVPRVAILYEPVAGGAMRGSSSLYGYLDGVTPDEPTTLFAAARSGSRFGQMDVLGLDSIQDVDLTQYGTIIAPLAVYLPEQAQVALHDFVLQGGALLVDAGVAMYQAGGIVTSMPPVMRELLGLQHTDLGVSAEEDRAAAGWPGYAGQPGQMGQPGIAIPVGPGEAGLAVDPDVQRFADILSEFLGRTDVTDFLGTDFVGMEGPGFRVRGLGRGYAIYAPTFLYENWDASDPYFNEFHGRVLSWRYDVEVVDPDALWPAVAVAAYSDWSVGVASPQGAAAAVDVYGAENQLYYVPAGAMRLANPEEENRIELLFPGAPLAVAHPVPIYLRPLESQVVVTGSVVGYEAERIELVVHGAGSQPRVGRQGIDLTGGVPTTMEIEIRDGRYQVAPGSMHRMLVEEGARGSRQSEQMIMPDRDTGALIIRAPFRWARVTIEPAPEL